MNPLLKKILFRYMAPAGEEGSDTTGTDTAVADSDDDYLALPEEERRKLRGDLDGDDLSQESRRRCWPAKAERAVASRPPAVTRHMAPKMMALEARARAAAASSGPLQRGQRRAQGRAGACCSAGG
ncbi:hypothetical protein ACHFCA_17300 [Delftia tsuruhatensis]